MMAQFEIVDPNGPKGDDPIQAALPRPLSDLLNDPL
jgi:hypothetical protein